MTVVESRKSPNTPGSEEPALEAATLQGSNAASDLVHGVADVDMSSDFDAFFGRRTVAFTPARALKLSDASPPAPAPLVVETAATPTAVEWRHSGSTPAAERFGTPAPWASEGQTTAANYEPLTMNQNLERLLGPVGAAVDGGAALEDDNHARRMGLDGGVDATEPTAERGASLAVDESSSGVLRSVAYREQIDRQAAALLRTREQAAAAEGRALEYAAQLRAAEAALEQANAEKARLEAGVRSAGDRSVERAVHI
jgi:hypothetical protein